MKIKCISTYYSDVLFFRIIGYIVIIVPVKIIWLYQNESPFINFNMHLRWYCQIIWRHGLIFNKFIYCRDVYDGIFRLTLTRIHLFQLKVSRYQEYRERQIKTIVPVWISCFISQQLLIISYPIKTRHCNISWYSTVLTWLL